MSTLQEKDARRMAAVRAYYETGDEAVLGSLLADLRAHVLSYIRGSLRVYDAERANDLAQETITKLLAKLQAHKVDADGARGSLGGLVCTISRNTLIDAKERKNDRPATPGANDDPFRLLATVGTAPDLLPDSAEATAKAGAVVEAATRAVLNLDPNARAAVVLHFYQGVPADEAAAQLGISKDTFRARLARGLASLRQWAAGQVAPTADTYAALRALDTGDLFTDYGLRLAS